MLLDGHPIASIDMMALFTFHDSQEVALARNAKVLFEYYKFRGDGPYKRVQ